MRHLILATLILLGACALEDEQGSKAAREAPDAVQRDEDADTPIPADPDARYSGSCDYVLGDFTETRSGYRFIGSAHIRNTGNVGAVVQATAKWFLSGSGPVVQKKKVELPFGKSKRISFTVVASQDEINRHQALGFDDNCKVRVSVLDFFGEPQD